MGALVRFAIVLALALAAGCLEVPGTTCEDGRLCPADRVCSSQGCVLPEQVEACGALDEGDRCSFSGVANGRCVDGVCVSAGCGNDETEADLGEVCDDGNTMSGDGCRADCQKLEVCGDALPDQGEDCDDGNSNAADGCDACQATTWAASSVVGGNTAATAVGLTSPEGVAVDRHGNLYIADTDDHRVRRVDTATGVITTIAGNGTAGPLGDGGPATSAQLRIPQGVAVDGLGAVYIADTFNHRIRRVDPGTGIISTVAGTGSPGFSGDGVIATSSRLWYPGGVVVDGLGNLYVADDANNRVRRVDAVTGVITSVAGIGQINFPAGLARDGLGNLYVADTGNDRIRRIDAATGTITTVPGTDVILNPRGVAVDSLGTLYVAASGPLRRIDATTGIITTVAGTEGAVGVAVGHDGAIYTANALDNRIHRVDATTGVITTVAGSGSFGFSADGGAASSAQLSETFGVAAGLDAVYIADTSSYRVRRVDASTGVITTVAGTGIQGFSGDDGAASSAEISGPYGLAVDTLDNLYIVDRDNNRIRKVDAATGVITTVAGNGSQGFSGDGGPATSAGLSIPYRVAVDEVGTLFIADTINQRIRRVDAGTGIITTVAGDGTPGFAGDGGLATSAQLQDPRGVAVDGLGNLYIADTVNHRIRRVDAITGFISTVAGTASGGFSGDGSAASSAQLNAPYGVVVDDVGNLFIADRGNNRIRRIDATTGVITTVAGSSTGGFTGDGGLATSAQLLSLGDVAVDPGGNLYIADTSNTRVRRVDASTGIITTVAGLIDPVGMGPIVQARLADPRALVIGPELTAIAGGSSGTVLAVRDEVGMLEIVAGRYPQTVATADLARFRTASFGTVSGVAHDGTAGVIYLSETSSNRLYAVTLVDPADEHTWTIAPLANPAGTSGFADGPVATAQFRQPTGLFLDEAARILYVADTGNHVIRAIDLSAGTVSTVAGRPSVLGFFGDDGAATVALLYQPEAITRCGNGDLFVADTGNHRVRRIDGGGVITTVLGDGIAASSGQGAPAHDFPVHGPRGLACDATGNLYVTSTTTVRQVAADEDGIVDGSGPVTSIFGAPPRDTFPAAVTFCLTGLAVVDAETLQVTDSCTGMLIELRREAAP